MISILLLLALPGVFSFPTSLSKRQQQSCPAGSPPSCPTPSGSVNSCCTETHGSILQTQFWDTATSSQPSTGPSNAWTIHGLWSDDCNGSYQNAVNCDSSRTLSASQISSLLQSQSPSTLSYMQTYWKNRGASDPSLWSHEWNTHGTCFSTLNPGCYTNYQSHQEVVEFFEIVVSLYKQLPTYQWLTAAGIVPSTTATYTLAQLEAVAQSNYGQSVAWGCSGTQLYQVFYYLTLSGNVQDGQYYTAAPTASSTCPKTGIQWLPK